jgi:hypothetical protein
VSASSEVPARRWDPVAVVALVLAVALVACRVRLLLVFGGAWTDEDQALLWFGARELAAGRLHEPYFFGQPYGSWFEAAVAVPLAAVGVPLRLAVAAGGSLLGTVPWLAFAGAAWWRRGGPAPVASVVVLAAGLGMAVEGSIVSTMPRGLLPGITLGCLVSAATFVWPRSRLAVGVFGLGLVVSASLNVGAALVTGPVAVHLVLSQWRGWRRLGPFLGGGTAVGMVAHVVAQRFYTDHPAYLVHAAPAFGFSWERWRENLGRLARYFSAYAPEVVQWWALPVVALGLVAVWVVVRRRTPATTSAVLVAVAMASAVLGTAKADDGVSSIFFPYSRIYLAFPWMVAALALLPGRSSGALAPRRAATWLAVLAALVGGSSAGVREVRLQRRVDALTAAALGQPPVAPASTSTLERRCRVRRRLAAAHDVRWILDRYDRTATYGCGALWSGLAVSTLFPEYDRRTWLLLEAESAVVDRVLVAGLDACPSDAAAVGRCELLDADERLYLLRGAGRSVVSWAEAAGLPVRATA